MAVNYIFLNVTFFHIIKLMLNWNHERLKVKTMKLRCLHVNRLSEKGFKKTPKLLKSGFCGYSPTFDETVLD